jgi:hypothetical protein
LSTLSHYLDRAYVINLPERKDWLRAIRKELHSIGMPFKAPSVVPLCATRSREAWGLPSPSVRGCFLSHHAILREARAGGLKSVFIMEDDLAFSPLLVDNLHRLLQQANFEVTRRVFMVLSPLSLVFASKALS